MDYLNYDDHIAECALMNSSSDFRKTKYERKKVFDLKKNENYLKIKKKYF